MQRKKDLSTGEYVYKSASRGKAEEEREREKKRIEGGNMQKRRETHQERHIGEKKAEKERYREGKENDRY
jgi:hypothetical protein